MESNSIIDAVTKEVMKRLGYEEDTSIKPIAKVLVLERYDSEDYKTIEQKLNFIGYQAGSIEDKKAMSEYEGIIVTSLCCKELANISIGVGCDEKEKMVLQSLLSGRKVFLIEEGLSYKKYEGTASKGLYKLYENYEQRLKDFGVVVLGKGNLIEGINEALGKGNMPAAKEETKEENKNEDKKVLELKDKKLLTESDIKEACENGYDEINVSKRTIITSLAIDCSKISGVKINNIY